MKNARSEIIPDLPAGIGHLVLRVTAGLMIFYIHGWHKLAGGIAYLQHGTSWRLAEEVAEMHFPAPITSAFMATIVQFACAPLLAIGLFTRANATLLTGTLSVAVLQNILANRDPQLAALYVVVMVSLVFLGGGRFSIDARMSPRPRKMAFGKGTAQTSPSVGHPHIQVDDQLWWWADGSDNDTIDIAGLAPGPHKGGPGGSPAMSMVSLSLPSAHHEG